MSVKNERHWFLRTIFAILCVFISAIAYAQVTTPPIVVKGVHVLALPDQTQVVLDLNNIPDHKVFTLSNPPRIVIDLPAVKLATSLVNVVLTHSPVLHIRTSRHSAENLRLVLDLVKPQFPELHIEDNPNNPTKQIIIDLTDKPKSNNSANLALQQTKTWLEESLPGSDSDNTSPVTQSAPEASPATTKKVNSIKKKTETVSMPATLTTEPTIIKRNPIVTVIIDPGHGGKDPGTTGSLGVHEKDVVLAISQALRSVLAKQPGYHAVLTRSCDYFIPLRGRLAIARKNRGDIFIAIHADAYKDPYATGASVFALSSHGASSEAARWLAEKENYSELGDVSLRDKSDLLRSVLIDLSQTATTAASVQLGQSLLQQLGKIGNLHYTTVEQAPFMVLKSPDIPSVLVETGFLSNPEEQARLRNPVDQKQIAKALAIGIESYFAKNPPPGSLIAAQQATKSEN